MWVRAGKQHTTQTNRLGTCNGKPEENLDEIGKTTQSRDWTFSCGSWRGGGKEGTPKPHKYLLQENRAWPVRGVFHGEKRWLYDEKGGCCFISLPLHQRQSTAEAAASELLHREGGNTNTFHLIQCLNSHLNPANQHEMLPLPWRDTKRLPRTSTDWGRMEEKLENKEGPEEKCTQPDGHRGCEHREQDAHLTTEQLQLTLCSLEATSNLNTAETLIQH